MIYISPDAAIIIPGIINSKKFNGAKPKFCTAPEINKFVLLPINVVMPPKIEAYDNGIITLLADILSFLATSLNIGMKITTTGVLFINALMITTMNKESKVAKKALLLLILKISFGITFKALD